MFGNANMNTISRNQENINSRVKIVMTDNARLTISLWNSTVTLKINPATGKDPSTGLVNYDAMRNTAAYVNMTNAQDFSVELSQKFIPEYLKALKGETFEEVSVSIVCGSSKKNMVTFELLNIDGNPEIKLGIYGPLTDQNTADPNTSAEFLFPTEVVYDKYSPLTGSSEKQHKVAGDFFLLVEVFNSITNMSGLINHGLKLNKSGGSGNRGFGSSQATTSGNSSTASWMSTTGGDELPF